MGTCFSCLEKQDNNKLNDRLIREFYCPQCQKTYLSNYEYNKHIVNCNKTYGDL